MLRFYSDELGDKFRTSRASLGDERITSALSYSYSVWQLRKSERLSNFPRATKLWPRCESEPGFLFLDTALLFHPGPCCRLPSQAAFTKEWQFALLPPGFKTGAHMSEQSLVEKPLGVGGGMGGNAWGRHRDFGGCVHCLFMIISWEPLLTALRATNRTGRRWGGAFSFVVVVYCSGGCARVSWEKGHSES